MCINGTESAVFGRACQVDGSFAQQLDRSFKIGLK